jgi:hypothetical protein
MLHYDVRSEGDDYDEALRAAVRRFQTDKDHRTRDGLAGRRGTLEASNLGTAEWRFQNGAALRNGIIAALLAKQGLQAAETALEGKYGFFYRALPLSQRRRRGRLRLYETSL